MTSGLTQAIVLMLITALVGRFATARSKLLWAVSHQHFYRMPRLDDGGSFPVITQQIWFQNAGRLPAEDIEIVFNWKPQHLEIWPPRSYQSGALPDGRFGITVPYLTGAEVMTVSMIDTIREMPVIVSVRSKSGLGNMVAMAPQRVWPGWMTFTAAALMLTGLTTLFYLLLQTALASYSVAVWVI